MMRDTLNHVDMEDRRERERTGSRPLSEARDLEHKWLRGEGNTHHRNFTTQSDRANARSFVEDLGDIGEDSLK